MHLYIDESYRQIGVYVLTALAIYEQHSQRAIRRAVKQMLCTFREHLYVHQPNQVARLPGGQICELKGGEARRKRVYVPGLNDYPFLRNEFFQNLIQGAHFRIYVLYFDRTSLMRWMPMHEQRRYGRLLQNLVSDVELLPPNAEFVGVTIDSQSAAKPVQEATKLYTWRKRRAGQRKQRYHDKIRHKRWSQQIDAVLKARYPGDRIHRRIWLVPSHLEKCLQATDVVANFCQRYHSLRIREAPYNHPQPSRAEKDWFEGYDLIADRVWWIHNRRLRKPKYVTNT